MTKRRNHTYKEFITSFVLILGIFALFNSCEDTSNNPKDDEENYPPGSRKYEWTADTIKAYYTYFNSIWGLAPDDVWAVSPQSFTYYNIYRYDGINWSRDTTKAIGNTVSLWGTENNIWICCKDGRIWNYSNGSFNSSEKFRYDDTDILFISMAGTGSDEIYVSGGKHENYNRDGIIYRYNGIQWTRDNVLKNYGNLYRIRYSSQDKKYYLLSYLENPESPDTMRLLEYDGRSHKTIMTDKNDQHNLVINTIDGYLYLTSNHKISRYIDGEFKSVIEVNSPQFGGQLWGRNRNDIFIRMKDGLLHYNGADTEYVLKFPTNIEFGSCALVLEKDIFIHAFDNNTGYNIIYHGKLKEE